jgi:hypothetical protein
MDARRMSRWFGALSLVVAGAALTLSTLFEPAGDDDRPVVAIPKIAAHLTEQRWLIAGDLLAVFILPATLYLMRLARPGSPRLALAGGTIAFAGWLSALLAFVGLDVFEYHAAQLADRAHAVALVQAASDDPVFGVLVAAFVVGHLLGMVLLGIALWRAGTVPRWAAALVAVATVVHLPAHFVSKGLDVAGYGLLAIAFAGCALALLREPDAEGARGRAAVPAVAGATALGG